MKVFILGVLFLAGVLLPADVSRAITLDDAKYYENEMQEELSQKLQTRAKELSGERGGQCVIFIKKELGIKASWGAARNVKVDTALTDPKIGDLVFTRESYNGHVARIMAKTPTHILVYESNYIRGGIIGTRWIALSSPKIRGFKSVNQYEYSN